MNARTALILAAGSGRRLQSVHQDPKGFLEINGQRLIDRSIDLLFAAGITEIIIATGYKAERFLKLTARDNRLKTIHNPKFAESGSMYTLQLATRLLENQSPDENILLLESDLLYEKRALALLQNGPGEAILISGKTNSGDEVYVYGQNNTIQGISKQVLELPLAGELTGISLLKVKTLSMLSAICAEPFSCGNLKLEYDSYALDALSKREGLPYLLCPDLIWCEVDDESHLKRAREKIIPALAARNS